MLSVQCCDLGYHASLNRALRTYLSAEYNLETSRHEGLDIIENAVDSLDLRSDRQRFMEMFPTAFCPPSKFEFQPHMGDEVHITNTNNSNTHSMLFVVYLISRHLKLPQLFGSHGSSLLSAHWGDVTSQKWIWSWLKKILIRSDF